MGEDTLIKLLRWYETWNSKLTEYITAQKYAEIIDSHFRNGVGLLSSMKSIMKHRPEHKEELKEKFEILRSKLVTIHNARKSIDTMK